MKRLKMAKTAALLSFLGLTASLCADASVLVDTIGDGSLYQVGGELTKTVSLGFDKHPNSGDFTGVRPVFLWSGVGQPPAGYDGGVTQQGTTGVPCAQIWSAGIPGELNPVSGDYATWIIQPFVPSQDGFITSVSFIAQFRQSAGYEQGTGTVGYVDIIDYPGGSVIPALATPIAVDFSSAKRGTILTANGFAKSVIAGNTYWLVFAPNNTLGAYSTTGLDYANLNWMFKNRVPDSAKVHEAMINANNGSGSFLKMKDHVLGIKISGYNNQPINSSIGASKNLADGTAVTISNAVITAVSGAIGPDFYYIQAADRSSGIRVNGTTTYSVGQIVTITGTMTTVAGLERAIQAEAVTPGTTASVKPLSMVNRNVGGNATGTSGAYQIGTGCPYGLNTVGQLVEIWGTVNNASGTSFNVNDGSKPPCLPNGIKCKVDSGVVIPTSGYAKVVGIISLELDGSVVKPVILVRQQSDITVY